MNFGMELFVKTHEFGVGQCHEQIHTEMRKLSITFMESPGPERVLSFGMDGEFRESFLGV